MQCETIIPKIRQETRRIKISFELKKDLQDDEVICEACHGTGLDISDNVYGIRGDTTHIGGHFPYKHQSINYCRRCYNGVLHKCPGCGSIIGKGLYHECPCGYHAAQRHAKWEQEEQERWEKAEKIPQAAAFQQFGVLYIDNMDRYVFDEDDLECAIDDYMDHYMDDADEDRAVANLRIYGTTTQSISLDAGNILENACEDLHEDAYERCDGNRLQKILDEWCKTQTGTETYYPNYKIGVILKI